MCVIHASRSSYRTLASLRNWPVVFAYVDGASQVYEDWPHGPGFRVPYPLQHTAVRSRRYQYQGRAVPCYPRGYHDPPSGALHEANCAPTGAERQIGPVPRSCLAFVGRASRFHHAHLLPLPCDWHPPQPPRLSHLPTWPRAESPSRLHLGARPFIGGMPLLLNAQYTKQRTQRASRETVC